jgi:hypothetical protein
MTASLVVVKEGGIVVVDGVTQIVKAGDLFEADHPAVAKFPNLFGPVALRFPVKRSVKVEQATAGPGEKRAR